MYNAKHRVRFICLLGVVITALTASNLLADPFTPQSNNTIVERLPAAIVLLSNERARLASQAEIIENFSPRRIEEEALAAYAIAHKSQDPRAFGRTLSVLQSWPEEFEKTATIHLLTAAVLQHSHQFESALTHIETALTLEPKNQQAWLIRAQISMVTADYAKARNSCNELRPIARQAITLNCQAQVDSLTGEAQKSLDALAIALQNSDQLRMQDYLELFITTADTAQRLEQNTLAENAYRAALKLSPDHNYVLINYAHFLSAQQRIDDVIALLGARDESTLTEEQRIVLASALMQSSEPELIKHGKRLKIAIENGFELAQQRGEEAPHKAIAQFSLLLDDNPSDAFRSASMNWTHQKEPSDSLLLAQTAIASGNLATLKALKQWLENKHSEDTRIEKLISKSEKSS